MANTIFPPAIEMANCAGLLQGDHLEVHQNGILLSSDTKAT
jgi:hypothetical protein